jgi:predicted short-subunit dehydrogenase-like oxidoreductase (DUF2520 family)
LDRETETDADDPLADRRQRASGTGAAIAPALLSIGFVGAGRAATALASGFQAAGHRILVAERGASAAALAAKTGRRPAPADDVLGLSDVIVLAVPDAAIGEVARRLAGGGRDGDGRVAVHLSGSQDLEPLAPLARRGFATAAVHPLQVLSGSPIPPGTVFAVEAEPAARALVFKLVTDLRGVVVQLPPRAREGYHAAAALAANLGMTLLAEAIDLMERRGIPRASALEGLTSLVGGGVDASRDLGLPEALTGPVIRGDAPTVRAHLRALDADSELRRAYAAVSLLALRQAARTGRPDRAAATEIRKLLEDCL